MTDKELKSKIADIIMEAIEEYNSNEINRPMIASVYAGEILDFLQEEPKPKFKVGDCIKPIDSCLGSQRTICEVCDGWYVTNQGTLDFEYEDNWELEVYEPNDVIWAYEEGYHQAEKDLELTWEDIERIFDIHTEIKCEDSLSLYSIEFYQEVLKRFKTQKGE